MTIILKLNPNKPDLEKIRLAANFIKRGGVVVFPTETVYGIGANALDRKASRKIFKIKGRPSDNPVIVHVSSIEMADSVAKIPKKYLNPLEKVWPGPLTIIVPARKSLPRIVTGGLDTVAIRMPSGGIALRLIKESGVPIAAPSANLSKRPSATKATHAKKYFNGKVDVIIDGGKSKFGVESTVLDLGNFEILRPGAFTPAAIKSYFGRRPRISDVAKGLRTKSKIRSPGTKYDHYSPAKRLLLFTGRIEDLPQITRDTGNFTFIGSNESCRKMEKAAKNLISLGKSSNPKDIASNLFDSLIKTDSLPSDFAIAESFDEKGIGLAIMNRLRKASGNRSFKNSRELSDILKSM